MLEMSGLKCINHFILSFCLHELYLNGNNMKSIQIFFFLPGFIQWGFESQNYVQSHYASFVHKLHSLQR